MSSSLGHPTMSLVKLSQLSVRMRLESTPVMVGNIARGLRARATRPPNALAMAARFALPAGIVPIRLVLRHMKVPVYGLNVLKRVGTTISQRLDVADVVSPASQRISRPRAALTLLPLPNEARVRRIADW